MYAGRVACGHLVSHSQNDNGTDGQTDGRQTVILRFPLDATSAKWSNNFDKRPHRRRGGFFTYTGQSTAVQSAAAVALMPLLIFCYVHRSSDSQCLSTGRITHKIARSFEVSGLHLIHGSLGTPELPTLTASRSVLPFRWPTDRQTTDHTSLSVSIDCILLLLRCGQ